MKSIRAVEVDASFYAFVKVACRLIRLRKL